MVQTKKVLWISRRPLSQELRVDLERALCAPVQVVPWTGTVEDMEDLRPALDQADAVAAVLPMEKLAQLLRMAGPKPVLQARGERVPTGRWRTAPGGGKEPEFAFVHRGWQQILDIQVKTRAL